MTLSPEEREVMALLEQIGSSSHWGYNQWNGSVWRGDRYPSERICLIHDGQDFNALGVFIAAAPRFLRALLSQLSTARLREQGLREAVTLIANSMGDVVTLGRFSRSVDPVRLVTAWHTDLCYAIHAALALPDAGDRRRALHRPDCQSLDYDRANCSCGATPALPEAGTPKECDCGAFGPDGSVRRKTPAGDVLHLCLCPLRTPKESPDA